MKKTTLLFLLLIAFVACGEKEIENRVENENKSSKESAVPFTLEGVTKMINASFKTTKEDLKTQATETFTTTGNPSFSFKAKDDKNVVFSCYVTGNKTGSIESISILNKQKLDKEKEFDIFLRYLEIADRAFKLKGDIFDLESATNIFGTAPKPDKTVKEFLEKVKKDRKKYINRSTTAIFTDNANRHIKIEFTSTRVEIQLKSHKL